MKLHRRSWIVRWAYLSECPPVITSLCPLFWRIVLLTPMKLTAIALVVFLVALGIYRQPYMALGIVAVSAVLLGAMFVAGRILDAMSVPTPDEERSLPYQMYRAVKDRVCPLVQIEP